MFFFFKQKTAYEMRISDWSSDVCSSDLRGLAPLIGFSIAESEFGQTTYLASSAVPATVSPAEDTSLPMPSTVLHALTMNIVAKNASPTILRISVSPDPKGTDALCDQKARHDENRSIMPTELSVARSMRRDAILAGVSMQFGLGHGYRGEVHVRAH